MFNLPFPLDVTLRVKIPSINNNTITISILDTITPLKLPALCERVVSDIIRVLCNYSVSSSNCRTAQALLKKILCALVFTCVRSVDH